MQTYRFPVLVWKDSGGFYTAALTDPEGVAACGVPVVAYGPSPKDAMLEIKEYLNWYYKKNPHAGSTSIEKFRLVHYKVPVRPEFRLNDKVFPYERSLTLTVDVVECTHLGGYFSAAIPRLGVEFFYTQGQLRDLVRHYVQEKLTGYPPHVVARYLPVEEVSLETVVTKERPEKVSTGPAPNLRNLNVVAEAMGTKTFKARYARPYGREREVATLAARLTGRGANVLLVGEQGSGKTSVLLEALRKVEKERDKERYARRFWQSRGARFIAGMRYLGQWEERTEYVIEELGEIEGVLCLESLQEVVQTGGRGPEDSIAAFLGPYVERGELVIVAEATPKELDTCRRLLPGFVDLFSTLYLPEFNAAEAQDVLSQLTEQLDKKYRITADPTVVGECYRLHKRFLPYHAFPGKASSFLHQLYEECKRKQERVDRESAVARFSRETGLPLKLLRDEELLPASEISGFFEERVVGQPEACRAVTNLVSTFKAGLNDPERPLGVMLFCGPTGVGKTEMAKAVSKCFFGAGVDRMVRLDMSEYSGAGAVYRLLGTQDRPGELVRKVREQPFTVVLLDEIEKADPDIFDLLLGVFDEGRLTDPWGRVTTFLSTVIIMTSNLGVSALRPIGINQSREPSYQAEVRDFFRPEFFNRIDSVVSFAPLSQGSICRIAAMELAAVAKREGVKERGLSLQWTQEVLTHLADQGYDARYGARPLKRTIEEQVVVPLARYLVDNPTLRDCSIFVERNENGEIVLG